MYQAGGVANFVLELKLLWPVSFCRGATLTGSDSRNTKSFASWMGAELCGEFFLLFFLLFPLPDHSLLKHVQ